MCSNAAGMPSIPERSDPIIRRLVKEAGGVVAEIDAPAPTEQSVSALEGLLDASEAGIIPWEILKAELTNTIRSIAKGETKASPAQLGAIKMILEKANEAAQADDEIRGVVILPVQGSGADMKIDDDWLKRMRALEERNAES